MYNIQKLCFQVFGVPSKVLTLQNCMLYFIRIFRNIWELTCIIQMSFFYHQHTEEQIYTKMCILIPLSALNVFTQYWLIHCITSFSINTIFALVEIYQ